MCSLRSLLLSKSQVEDILEHGVDGSAYESISIMTIVEPLLILEDVKKKGKPCNASSFRTKWETLIRSSLVHVVGLDQDALLRGLFDNEEGHKVDLQLWGEVTDCTIPPDRTIRRIILRPSDMNWWEYDLYQVMEDWFD